MRSWKLRPSFSDSSETSFRFGRNRRRVLLLAWDTLLPLIGPLPVSSQTRDMILFLRFDPARASARNMKGRRVAAPGNPFAGIKADGQRVKPFRRVFAAR